MLQATHAELGKTWGTLYLYLAIILCCLRVWKASADIAEMGS